MIRISPHASKEVRYAQMVSNATELKNGEYEYPKEMPSDWHTTNKCKPEEIC